jgi:hypothetical protein
MGTDPQNGKQNRTYLTVYPKWTKLQEGTHVTKKLEIRGLFFGFGKKTEK